MDHPISKIFVLFMFLMQLLDGDRSRPRLSVDFFTSTSTEMEERNNTNSDTCYQSCCTHFVTRNLDSSNTEESQTKLSWPVYILVCLFGLGSWLAINGIWMELPVLVDHAPEKWSLPSYLTVITELANVGPLIYFVGNKFAPKKVHERTAVYTITILGSIACILLTLFWDKTSHIFGSTRSTALIVLSFFVALVDCTSTVTFLPFMAILPQIYMSALFLGENLSSLLPSFVALIQGVDKRKLVAKTICDSQGCQNATVTVFTGLNFGPNYFFLFLAFMMLLCGIAFIALNYLSAVKKHHVLSYSDLQRCSQNKPTKKIVQNISEDDIAKQSLLDSNSLLAKEHLDFSSELALPSLPGSTQEDGSVASRIPEAKTTIIYLFILQAWINSISNGAISQIQAYACEPYGATAYHLGKSNLKLYYCYIKCT